MPTENVVQIHNYIGIVLEKDDKMLTFVWCEPTGRILDATSLTIPVTPFIHQDINVVYNKLLDVGWKVKERYDNVEMF